MSRIVHRHSWFNRVGGALTGGLLGLVLFLAAFPLLFWNEGRALKTARALQEGAASIVELTEARLDPAHEGRFVHVSGLASTEEVLSDEQFGVAVNAIRLERRVEMYQWRESKKTITRNEPGGGSESVTTFSYTKKWSSEVIDSQRFHEAAAHQNPTEMPFTARQRTAQTILLGAFQLPTALIEEISRSEPLRVSLDQVPAELKRNLTEYPQAGQATGFVWSRWAVSEEPEIGDVRISFSYTPPSQEVSVMGAQTGKTFRPFTTENGRQLFLLSMGRRSADEMISRSHSQNSGFTWMLRGVGWLMMFGGTVLVLRPLSVLADVLPAVGHLVAAGAHGVAALVAGAFALSTISCAWLFFRPLIGVSLLVAALCLLGLLAWQVLVRSRRQGECDVAAGAEQDERQLVEEAVGA